MINYIVSKTLFFNSSCPRACSTLLQNILGQNPDFYVTPTSGLLELIYSSQSLYTSSPEFKAQDPYLMEKAWLGFCKAGLLGYFENITCKPYVVDKSRGWHMKYALLENIFGKPPKILCMVRDIKGMITSMEKLHRKTEATKYTAIVDHQKMQGTTTAKRVDIFLSSQPLGMALERFSESILKGWAKNMLFIRAEDLTSKPKESMERIYQYLEVPSYEHSFNAVDQITVEDDEVYGLGDGTLHVIRKEVKPIPDDSQEVLGRDICKWIDEAPQYEWYRRAFGYGTWKHRGELA